QAQRLKLLQGSDKHWRAADRNKRLRLGLSQPFAHAPGRNDDLYLHGSTLSNRVKIMRPAAVCRTLVTTTCTILPMCTRPPSTTTIVPSSRYPTPWLGSFP